MPNKINKVNDTILTAYAVKLYESNEFPILNLAKKTKIKGDTIKVPVLNLKNENENLTVAPGELAKKIELNNSYEEKVATKQKFYISVTEEDVEDNADDTYVQVGSGLAEILNTENENKALAEIYTKSTVKNTVKDTTPFSVKKFVNAQNKLKNDNKNVYFFCHPDVFAEIVSTPQYYKNFNVQEGDAKNVMGNIIVKYNGVKKVGKTYKNFLLKDEALIYFTSIDPKIEEEQDKKRGVIDFIATVRSEVALPDSRLVSFYETTEAEEVTIP